MPIQVSVPGALFYGADIQVVLLGLGEGLGLVCVLDGTNLLLLLGWVALGVGGRLDELEFYLSRFELKREVIVFVGDLVEFLDLLD